MQTKKQLNKSIRLAEFLQNDNQYDLYRHWQALMVENERNCRIDFIENSSKPMKDLRLSFHVLELSTQLNTVQLGSREGRKKRA